MTLANKERRQARRFDLRLVVVVEKPFIAPGVTRDVSTRGVYFTTTAKLEVGVEIEYVLILPDEITHGGEFRIRCHGRVVRVNPAGGVSATVERSSFYRCD
jgi:PilZ domain